MTSTAVDISGRVFSEKVGCAWQFYRKHIGYSFNYISESRQLLIQLPHQDRFLSVFAFLSYNEMKRDDLNISYKDIADMRNIDIEKVCSEEEGLTLFYNFAVSMNDMANSLRRNRNLALEEWGRDIMRREFEKQIEELRKKKTEKTTEKITELKPENIKVEQSADIERLTKRSDLIQRIEKAKAVSQSEREELRLKYGKDIIAEIIAENERELSAI
ncbi:hypothetical protein Barb6_00159 [Bacteroidales bacterium Barb6]|nr:hypothetical protein Barb6_00159 [Bacteroidales bacterium Barb6]